MYDLLEVHHVHHENSKLIHDRVEYFVYPFPDCRILSENDDSFLPSPSKGGAGATPHFSFFFILTLLHLELWRPISNLPAFKSKSYKTVIKDFIQGGRTKN